MTFYKVVDHGSNYPTDKKFYTIYHKIEAKNESEIRFGVKKKVKWNSFLVPEKADGTRENAVSE